MAKPSDTYQWSTDGGSTTDPGSARKATGFRNGKKAPSKWFNWLHHGAGLWFAYLDNLHAEDAFLDEDFAWAGQHTHVNETNYAAAKSRTIMLDLSRATITNGVPSWSAADGWHFTDGSDEVTLTIDEVPSGATISGLEFGYKQATSSMISTQWASVGIRRRTYNRPGGNITLGSESRVYGNSAIGLTGVAGNLAISAAVNNATSHLQLTLQPGVSDIGFPGENGNIYWVAITYSETRASGHF